MVDNDHACRYQLITPLHSDQWEKPVLVNRGWVPATWRSDTKLRQQWESSSNATLEAVTRVSEDPSSFVPHNNPKTGEWFWIDVPAMTISLGLPSDTPLVEVGLPINSLLAFRGNKPAFRACPSSVPAKAMSMRPVRVQPAYLVLYLLPYLEFRV